MGHWAVPLLSRLAKSSMMYTVYDVPYMYITCSWIMLKHV